MNVCPSCRHDNRESAKFCEECGFALAALPAAAKEQRRTVTVVFCDIAGSTTLGETVDPERVRAVLARYFDRMKAIVERHGGSVEKFIGDAVMAVFGVPVVHEDDALRAVRAAVEMRDALPELGLQGRIGVMTGEVVTGTEERLATGDAVNVAARLEQAAKPGEALLGMPTLALVREAVEVETVEPLLLKGKAEPVQAFRLVRVLEERERHHDARFVGRERELALLAGAWDRTLAEQTCVLVTVVGEPGIGKSRLVAEFLASLDATVVRGRCLPYGEGITYWPVVEVLKQLDLLPPEEAAQAAIRSLLGASDDATSGEEIAWAFRKTLEHAAGARPLVTVFDDIQWGEPRFLDVIEHMTLLSSGAAILLLCIARSELTESSPVWPVTLRLEALGDEDVDELIPERFAGELRERIARAAGGNPLFVEEMVEMAGEAEGDVVVPPTLQALLAARLDQLERGERSVLERAAVEGEVFHRGAVQALAPEETQVTPRLAALVRKELIRPDRPVFPGEDGFSFRHLLIRDAAYDGLPKSARAELHQRFAAWLEQHGVDLVEFDELLGYHLEQANSYRAELGLPRDDELAARARRRLTAAGNRAILRQDYGAAVSLYERASALMPADEFDFALENELGYALIWTGRGDDALRRADALVERASAAGDRIGELCGRLHRGNLGIDREPAGAEKLSAIVAEAVPVFQAADDDIALYLAYVALTSVAWSRGQMDRQLEAHERAIVHARRAGYVPPGSFGERAACRFFGTTSVSELLAWLDENEPRHGRDHFFRAYRAGSLAMLGRFDEARAILAEQRAELAERGGGVLLANITAFESVWLELWAGDPATAAEFGAEGFRLHEELGERSFLSNAAATLGRALYAVERLDEAEVWAARSTELSSSEDRWTEMIWRQVRAKVLARRGEHAEAERLAREAVAICDDTEMLDQQGDAYADFAEVLQLVGKTGEAAGALEAALDRYERKGNVVMTDRVRSRLAGLQPAAT